MAAETIDVGGNFVLPRVIDAHTHLREPWKTGGRTSKSGTEAAATGGVTTVFEMPLSVPCVSSAEVLKKRRSIVEKSAVVDFGLYSSRGYAGISLRYLGLAAARQHRVQDFMHGPPEGSVIKYEGATLRIEPC